MESQSTAQRLSGESVCGRPPQEFRLRIKGVGWNHSKSSRTWILQRSSLNSVEKFKGHGVEVYEPAEDYRSGKKTGSFSDDSQREND